MKITSLGTYPAAALIFVIILLPFYFHNDLRLWGQARNLEIMNSYDGALYQAVSDAAFALKLNEQQELEYTYADVKDIRANKELAIESFYHTLYSNFDILEDPISQEVLKAYVPAVAVIDYDGLWIHADGSYFNVDGELEVDHVWNLKQTYVHTDKDHNSFAFTLNDYVQVIEEDGTRWEGTREEVNAITGGRIELLQDADLFEQVRRGTIIRIIQEQLSYTINLHNEKVKRYGISYVFTLPILSQEEWNNTIDDIGVIAFVQGIPMQNEVYNNYALGGSRLILKESYYGSTENGIKVYYPSRCQTGLEVEEIFFSPKQAASRGYFPRSCLNQ